LRLSRRFRKELQVRMSEFGMTLRGGVHEDR